VIRVLVVDDHPIVREGLVAVLEDQPEIAVVGAAQSGEEALTLAAHLQPEVALLDLELPGMSGLETIPRLLETVPALRIVVFTAYDTDARVFGALEAGAKGYLLKGAPVEEIVRAIHAVYTGGSHLEARVAARVVTQLRVSRRPAGGLSERERTVLRLIADGLPNKQIAHTLGITERTVKFHVTSLFQKLNVENRAQAVAVAGQQGLL
jgi:DNA-binding NarL/FixJ family response regulator